MTGVVKAKDGSIIEIKANVTIGKLGSCTIVRLPKDFFEIGKLPWNNPDKVEATLKLTGKKPRVILEIKDDENQKENETMGQALNEAMRKPVPGVS